MWHEAMEEGFKTLDVVVTAEQRLGTVTVHPTWGRGVRVINGRMATLSHLNAAFVLSWGE